MSNTLTQLSQQLGRLLLSRGWQIACAESCTGGQLAATITNTPGSSAYFSHGWVTYSDKAKQQLLGVRATTLAEQGAVSEAVAQEMAINAQCLANATVAIAITGIAGPSGGSNQKPVGLVCFAWAIDNAPVTSQQQQFLGDRTTIRQQATEHALSILCQHLKCIHG
ncbi:MAG: CinA family protein [Candidatus Symbiodolus clandestinus]